MYIFDTEKSYIIFGPKFGSIIIRNLHKDSTNLLEDFDKDKIACFRHILEDHSKPIIITYRSAESWFYSALMEAVFGILYKEEVSRICYSAAGINLNNYYSIIPPSQSFNSRPKHLLRILGDSNLSRLMYYIMENFDHTILEDPHLNSHYFQLVFRFLSYANLDYRNSLQRIHIYNLDSTEKTPENINMSIKLGITDPEFTDTDTHFHSNGKYRNLLSNLLKKEVLTLHNKQAAHPFSFYLFFTQAKYLENITQQYFKGLAFDHGRLTRVFPQLKS